MTLADRLPAWHVAFIESDCPAWWSRLLRPGFRHCFMFAADGPGRWILIDPVFDGAHIRIVDDAFIAGLVAEIRKRDGTVVIAAVEGVRRAARPRLLLTCVSVVLGILGCPARALTPYALFRRLIERGAVCAPGFDGADDGRVFRRRLEEGQLRGRGAREG